MFTCYLIDATTGLLLFSTTLPPPPPPPSAAASSSSSSAAATDELQRASSLFALHQLAQETSSSNSNGSGDDKLLRWVRHDVAWVFFVPTTHPHHHNVLAVTTLPRRLPRRVAERWARRAAEALGDAHRRNEPAKALRTVARDLLCGDWLIRDTVCALPTQLGAHALVHVHYIFLSLTDDDADNSNSNSNSNSKNKNDAVRVPEPVGAVMQPQAPQAPPSSSSRARQLAAWCKSALGATATATAPATAPAGPSDPAPTAAPAPRRWCAFSFGALPAATVREGALQLLHAHDDGDDNDDDGNDACEAWTYRDATLACHRWRVPHGGGTLRVAVRCAAAAPSRPAPAVACTSALRHAAVACLRGGLLTPEAVIDVAAATAPAD